MRDISRQKALERQLRHQALHDPLTGLPNRTLFNDRLTKALERTSRSGEAVAVMFLDLDDFKSINDSLGHSIGDELLVSVAERLGECLRPSDTVSRMGGDEFTILLDAVDGKVEASQIAQRIVDRFHSPVTISDGGMEREVSVTISVGVVLEAPGGVDSGATAEELLKRADVALYRAKDSGRDHYLFFHPETEE
jgi:diguanylate cyclase (GGDEF)-like protein